MSDVGMFDVDPEDGLRLEAMKRSYYDLMEIARNLRIQVGLIETKAQVIRSYWPVDLADERIEGRWYAPWTMEQIEALNAHQRGDTMIHPYTCGFKSTHPNLVPTQNGWICVWCSYRQNWAHPAPLPGGGDQDE